MGGFPSIEEAIRQIKVVPIYKNAQLIIARLPSDIRWMKGFLASTLILQVITIGALVYAFKNVEFVRNRQTSQMELRMRLYFKDEDAPGQTSEVKERRKSW